MDYYNPVIDYYTFTESALINYLILILGCYLSD